MAVLLYVEDWTLRDIGVRLGVSESRVSQIHTQLRRRLYEQLLRRAAAVHRLRLSLRGTGHLPEGCAGPVALTPFTEPV